MDLHTFNKTPAAKRARMSRRSFLLGGALGALGAMSLTAAEAYQARYSNPYEPRLERVDIRLPEGAEALDGTSIAFVTDTHVGPFIDQDDLARATALLDKEQPDLILLGGDLVSESPRYIGGAVEVLQTLIERAPQGGFAVLGNHDFNVSASKVTEGLSQAGFGVLRNDATSVTINGTELWIGGIDETLLGRPSPPDTFAQIPEDAVSIALWHEPQFAEQAAAQGPFLQLSGHTHGGQIRIPGVGPVGLPVHGKRYVIGLNDADGMAVYTSRGVGVYRPPMRFNCPPEVTLITLVSAS